MFRLRSSLSAAGLALVLIAPAGAVPVTPGTNGGVDPAAPFTPNDGTSNTVTLPEASNVPEPATLGLLAAGLGLLALRRRRG